VIKNVPPSPPEDATSDRERFRSFFDLGLIGMAITSPVKGILEVNDELCAILGYARHELLRMTWAELTHPEDLAAGLAIFERALAGDIDRYSLDKRLIRKDRRVIDATISVRCVRRPDGSVDYFLAFLQDVSERTVRFASILDSIPDTFFLLSHDWRFTYLNRHARAQMERLGKDPAVLIGRVFWEEFPEVPNEAALRRVMSERIAMTDEFYYPLLGEWVENHLCPSIDGGVIKFQRYITERKRVEVALRRGEEERTQLIHRILTAQEEEGRRISRELHDQCGQQVSLVSLKLAALKRAAEDRPDLRTQIESLEVIVRQLDSDIDSLSWTLRPAALDELGLVPALSNFTTTWSHHSGVRSTLHTNGMDDHRLTGDIETVLYRLLQESLSNVAKHAEATEVQILLSRHVGHISLIVEDNGKGFVVDEASGSTAKRLGLVGMRERAALVHGAVVFESQPGSGATVFVRIPWSAACAGVTP
jgi:PAS domain S-box-containing protein